MRSPVAFVLAAIAVAAIAPYTAAFQDEPRFEVASIRRNVSNTQQGSGLSAPQPGGRYVGLGVTLRRLVSDAYDAERVLGGPAWADSDRFDVNARGGGDPTPAEIRRMLRPLLAERFKLKVHSETREMPVYLLTAVRPGQPPSGGKIRVSDAACAAEARRFVPGALGFPPPCGDYRRGARTLVARGRTMSGLAGNLAGAVGRPVLDRTGFGDTAFDFELEWSSNLGLIQPPPDSAGFNELQVDGLSLFTALQEQLGLRLDAARAPVPVLVIDSAEPPSPD